MKLLMVLEYIRIEKRRMKECKRMIRVDKKYSGNLASGGKLCVYKCCVGAVRARGEMLMWKPLFLFVSASCLFSVY